MSFAHQAKQSRYQELAAPFKVDISFPSEKFKRDLRILGATQHLLSRADLPVLVDFALDLRVLAFTVILTIVTGLAVGLAPALRVRHLDLLPALREDNEALSLERNWFSLKNALVVVQVVVSFLLIVGTSFFIRMLSENRAKEVGFAVGGVAMVETDPRYAGYSSERAQRVMEEFRDRVSILPGVESVSLVAGTPMTSSGGMVVDEDGDPETGEWLPFVWADSETFKTLGIPLLYGRTFDEHDRADMPAVALVNESMARRYFGTVDAVGQRFSPAKQAAHLDSPTEEGPDSFEVIGVVADTLLADLGGDPGPVHFRSLVQAAKAPTTLVARSSRDASSLLGAMQRELGAIDPDLPAIRAKTMQAQLDDSLATLELVVAFLGSLGAVGLTLACIGLYSVVSYAVAQRSREVGIRTALGGRTSQVTWAISRDVAKLLAAAVAAGTALSMLGIRLLSTVNLSKPAAGVHVNMPTIDATTLPAIALILLAVGLAATWIPARRAAKADPLSVLRHE